MVGLTQVVMTCLVRTKGEAQYSPLTCRSVCRMTSPRSHLDLRSGITSDIMTLPTNLARLITATIQTLTVMYMMTKRKLPLATAMNMTMTTTHSRHVV